MNKKITAALCAASVTAAVAATASADDITVLLNGNAIEFDVAPIIENDRTLVPLRAIFEALGAEVEWDAATQTVISAKGDDTCIFQIGNDKMFVNGEAKTLDVAAKIVDDRTLIPLRAVSEAYNCTVEWDGAARCVTIVSAE